MIKCCVNHRIFSHHRGTPIDIAVEPTSRTELEVRNDTRDALTEKIQRMPQELPSSEGQLEI